MATAEQIPPAPQPEATAPARPGQRTYTCPECDHTLRVVGRGRHQLYFPDGEQTLRDPVMDGRCPTCGHDLSARYGASRA